LEALGAILDRLVHAAQRYDPPMRLGQVLVTGAGGFVGRHLVDRAQALGVSTVASEGDLHSPEAARRAVAEARPSAVVHLAGVPVGGSGAHVALAANAAICSNLLDAVAEHAPGIPLLVPGSAAEYGLGSPDPLIESAPLAPVSAYGAVKLALERACLAAEGVRVIWARSFNHLGPGQGVDAPVAGWASQLVEAERGGPRVLRTGRLEIVRDFLDVRDVADAYLALVASVAEGPVNVCSGRPVRLQEVVDRLVGAATVEVSIETDPKLLRGVDPPTVVGNPGRLRTLTGWQPARRLEESLGDVLEEWRRRPTSDPAPAAGAPSPAAVVVGP